MKTSELMYKYDRQLLERDLTASKCDYGKLLIIGGSFGMCGAAYLAGLAAFRSGIGMVRFYSPECNRVILQSLLPEAMVTSDRFCQEEGMGNSGINGNNAPVYDAAALDRALAWADAVVCGPGLSQSAYAKAVVNHLFSCDLSSKDLILLDADALNIISTEKFRLKELSLARSRKGISSNVVITPHIGEMSRLTEKSIKEVKSRKSQVAKEFAKTENCTVVLKDFVSYVAVPSGKVYENNSGNPALAKAGSGDVLCGVIAGISEVIGRNAMDGAVLGTFVHGRAGDTAALYHGVHSTLARDVADAVSSVIGSYSYKYDRVFDGIEDMMEEELDFGFPEEEGIDIEPSEKTDMSKTIRFKSRNKEK